MKTQNDWKTFTHFGGFDWAGEHHDVVIVDAQGSIVAQWRFDHDPDGWKEFRAKVAAFPFLAVAVETSQGLMIEQMLDAGLSVYPVQPKAAQRYRDRKAPSGTKTDQLDAWSLADALRMDGQHWKPLAADDPLVTELRLLCRDEVALIENRTSLLVQLHYALKEYYPAALEACNDWRFPSSWALVETFPTPQLLQAAGKRRWEKFLHANQLWKSPQSVERRMAIFARAAELSGSEAVTRAKSRLALALIKTLRTLQKQLDEYRAAIEKLFADHPDHDVFGSLPGVGRKLGPRLLSELGDNRERFDGAAGLQCYAGTAPVSFQSGQIHKVNIRRHCNKHLRHAMHQWADLSRAECAWAAAYYQAHRDKGQSKAVALRCLANRWMKILWKMWQTHTPYDEAFHTKNQTQHGSWVLQLKAA